LLSSFAEGGGSASAFAVAFLLSSSPSVAPQNAIQLPIHNCTLDAHDTINSDTNQSGISRTVSFNAAPSPTEVQT
jgi:hypothetical protein